jgi:GYF domain 2
MNWYFEKNGISQGPHSEAELEAKVRGNELHQDSLVWHVGQNDWQPVSSLRPQWLEMVKPPEAVVTTPSKAPAPAAKSVPVKPTTTEQVKKPGLLTRLFGFGKSK